MKPMMYEYNGYKVTVRGDGEVAVFDPRNKRGPALYQTTSLDLAAKWIDAYCAGEHWAVAS